MKVGVITFHRAINYGALLQTYAFQQLLMKKGVSIEVIDYRSKIVEERHHKYRLCWNVKESLRFLLYGRKYNKVFNLFRIFLYEKIVVSRAVFSNEDLMLLSGKYDLIIIGSDQVWNTILTKRDYNYFGEFVIPTVKLVSYAASFGYEKLPSLDVLKVEKLLKKFSYISVRERSGVHIIKENFGLLSTLVLDPTLLLKTLDWKDIIKDYKRVPNYILLYFFDVPYRIFDYARLISKVYNKNIVVISHNRFKELENVVYEEEVGPEEFLGIFANADAIITNSFHGTVFSINFNKPFLVDVLPDNSTVDVNSRLLDILSLLKLEKQLLKDNIEVNQIFQIDYSAVNKLLEEQRMLSLKYIDKVIG